MHQDSPRARAPYHRVRWLFTRWYLGAACLASHLHTKHPVFWIYRLSQYGGDPIALTRKADTSRTLWERSLFSGERI